MQVIKVYDILVLEEIFLEKRIFMIIGIGCDITTIVRIEKSIKSTHGKHFLKRMFAEQEIALFGENVSNYERAAANFAAKEAFGKATGKGLTGFGFCEVMALRNESGAPHYAFTGSAQKFMKENGYIAHLSITHENGLAMAYCVLEKQ